MSQVSIRPVVAADIPVLLTMIEALALHHEDISTVTEAALARDVLGPHPWLTMLVAEQDDAQVGYAALCPLAQCHFGVRGMDIHHLFVHADHRGKGVGQALIDGCLALAKERDCRYLTVGTHPDNLTAQGIYLSAGFEDLPPAGPRFRMKW